MDGYDFDSINTALINAKNDDRPSIISCKTLIGYGSPNKQGTSSTHGAPLGENEISLTRRSMGWPYEPFHIPDNIMNLWRTLALRNKKNYENWKKESEEKIK